jgi:hypothetical protein
MFRHYRVISYSDVFVLSVISVDFVADVLWCQLLGFVYFVKMAVFVFSNFSLVFL